MTRSPIIGIMGGGSASSATMAAARNLGAAIAREGWILLNGGRNAGIMKASSEGAASEGGVVIGILPDAHLERMAKGVTIPIRTGLGDGRNLVNVLSSDMWSSPFREGPAPSRRWPWPSRTTARFSFLTGIPGTGCQRQRRDASPPYPAAWLKSGSAFSHHPPNRVRRLPEITTSTPAIRNGLMFSPRNVHPSPRPTTRLNCLSPPT